MRINVCSIICILVIHIAYANGTGFGKGNTICAYGCSCRDYDRKNESTVVCSSTFLPRKEKLTFIPILPLNVTRVTLSGCSFPNITGQLLLNLTILKLKDLIFQLTGTKDIAKDAFMDFPYLKSLEIKQNQHLHPESVKCSLSGLNKSIITTVRFESNDWEYLPIGMFDSLAESEVSVISLKGNLLQNVEGKEYSMVAKLRELYLNENKHLHSFIVNVPLKSLTKLDLSVSNFIKIPVFCHSGNDTLLPNLQSLIVQKNGIKTLAISNYRCLKRLKELNLNLNCIKRLKNNSFSDLVSLRTLRLDSQVCGGIKTVEAFAFNSTSLNKLSFRSNQFPFNNTHIYNPNTLFRACPNLTFLNLEGNVMRSFIRKLFLPLRKIENLILQRVKLETLPTGVFQLMPSLRNLSLGGNSIYGWNDDSRIFSNITWLEKLNLHGNKIRTVNKTSFPPEMLKGLKYLDLTDNQFACTCELMWFRNWIRQNKSLILTNWPNNYRCRSPPDLNNLHLDNFNPTEDSCRVPNIIIIIAIILSVVCVTAVIIISVLYKARWHIRYGIYLLRAKRQGYNRINGNNEDFEYDAFVIYSEENRDFVHERLIPKIEEEHGYRLCIHYRDFDVGRLIADNIIESINKSKQVIAVLSNSFARSEWCHFELRISQRRYLDTNSDMLILVMLEEINNRHLSSSLKSLITTTTYAVWTEEEVGQTQFWDQVLNALSHY